MTRLQRIVAALVAVLALAAAATASAAEQPQPTLRVSSGAALPYRALVLGLPADAQLDSSSLKVFENGERVKDVTVTPASASGADQFATVLVIDASNSMHGEPEAAALNAAGTLVTHLPANSQVGVVAFNRTSAKTHSGVWRDLAIRRRRTEVDVQIAPIAEIGARHGIDCRATHRLVAMIHEVENGTRQMTDDNLLELSRVN